MSFSQIHLSYLGGDGEGVQVKGLGMLPCISQSQLRPPMGVLPMDGDFMLFNNTFSASLRFAIISY